MAQLGAAYNLADSLLLITYYLDTYSNGTFEAADLFATP